MRRSVRRDPRLFYRLIGKRESRSERTNGGMIAEPSQGKLLNSSDKRFDVFARPNSHEMVLATCPASFTWSDGTLSQLSLSHFATSPLRFDP